MSRHKSTKPTPRSKATNSKRARSRRSREETGQPPSGGQGRFARFFADSPSTRTKRPGKATGQQHGNQAAKERSIEPPTKTTARPYAITTYPSRYDVDEPTTEHLTLTQIARRCRAGEHNLIEAGEKDDLPFWHGARLREGGGRRNADVVAVSMMFLDIDHGFKKAVARLRELEIRALAFSSPSGRKGRGRVLLPLKREVAPDEHGVLMAILDRLLGGDVIDPQARSPSHGFFVPAIVRRRKSCWQFESIPGKVLDPDKYDLTTTPGVVPVVRRATADELSMFDLPWRRLQVETYVDKLPEVSEGDRHGTLYRLAQKCLDYDLPDPMVEEIVLAFNSDWCRPPKTSDVVRTRVLKDAEKYRRHARGCALTLCAKVEADRKKTVERVVKILVERASDLYVFGGELCQLSTDDEGRDQIERLRWERALPIFSHHVRLYRWDAGTKDREPGWVRTDWDEKLTRMVLSMSAGDYVRLGMRPLRGIANAPTLRRDGTIFNEPGYDAAETANTRLVFLGNEIDISEQPEREEGAAALARIDEIFDQFPFETDAQRSAHLALLLTAVARPLIDGPVPITVIDATQKQSGKSLLGQAVCITMSGHMGRRVDWTNENTQMPERLHAAMVTDGRLLFFDNVETGSILRSGALDGALTTRSVTRRRLYGHGMFCIPFDPIVLVTGNGLRIAGDLGPRTLRIRLVSPHARPEERDDLKIENLVQFLIERRAEIVRDLLTAWRAFLLVDEKKRAKLKPWRTFEAWTIVRQLLDFYDRPDPVDARAFDIDDEQMEHGRFLRFAQAKWPQHGFLSSQLCAALEPRRIGGLGQKAEDEDKAQVRGWILAKAGALNARDVGLAIAAFRDTVHQNGLVLRHKSVRIPKRNKRGKIRLKNGKRLYDIRERWIVEDAPEQV